ncbi:MAG: laccase domain-containing protein [Clostridia bacterium]|nr:laccase domain-containing protein [Clostridia bacterium]
MNLSNENVIHVIDGEVEYIQFKRLLDFPEVVHAFGLKPLDYRAHGENNQNVPEAYAKLAGSIGVEWSSIVRPGQKHTNHVLVIESKENQEAPDMFLDYLKETDGLITDKSKIALATTNADCIILLFYDPIKKVIASVHSGWRGTFQKIAQVTVRKMKEQFGCQAQDMIVCICPSIRVCHFEVEDDVKDMCEQIFADTGRLEEIIHQGDIKEGKQKYFIDTILITKILLEAEGVFPENIIDSGICSVCASEKVHSRRADGAEYGLGTGMIYLK